MEGKMDSNAWTKMSLYGMFVEVGIVLWLILLGDSHINTLILVLFSAFFIASLLSFLAGCMALLTAKREKIPTKGKVIAFLGMATTAVIWLVLMVISIVF